MGLFRFEGVTQRSVIIEQAEGVLNLLPTVPLGGPGHRRQSRCPEHAVVYRAVDSAR